MIAYIGDSGLLSIGAQIRLFCYNNTLIFERVSNYPGVGTFGEIPSFHENIFCENVIRYLLNATLDCLTWRYTQPLFPSVLHPFRQLILVFFVFRNFLVYTTWRNDISRLHLSRYPFPKRICHTYGIASKMSLDE